MRLCTCRTRRRGGGRRLRTDNTIILPLVAAIVLATGLSHQLSPHTISTLKLRRRGVDRGHPSEMLGRPPMLLVRDVMASLSDGIDDQATLAEATALAGPQFGILPVRHDGELVGVVTARGGSDAFADGRHEDAAASLAVEISDSILETDTLPEAAEALARNDTSGLPVRSLDDAVTGWLDYRTRFQTTAAPSARRGSA